MEKPPISVSINMGSACNFRCKYCFEVKNGAVNDSKRLQQKVKERVIDVIKLLTETNKVRIEFWGGEPTVYFDDIYEIIEATKAYEEVTYFMYTNGSLVEKYSKELLQIKNDVGHRFQVQVSYDYHDLKNNQRIQLNKTVEETEKMVLDAIHFFDDNDFFFGTKTTCTMHDLEENLFHQYMNFENLNKTLKHKVNFNPTPDTLGVGNVNYNKIEKQFIQLLKYFVKNKKFGKTGFMWFDMPSNADCTGGIHSFQVDVDGKVTYCHGCLYSKKDLFYTSVFDDNFLHKVDYNYLAVYRKYKKNSQCSDCNSQFCFRCNAINSDGSIEDWDKSNLPDVCKLYNTISDYIRAYYKITH